MSHGLVATCMTSSPASLTEQEKQSLISDVQEHSHSSKARHYQKFERLKRDVCRILFHHKLAIPVIRKAAISHCCILQTTRLFMNNFCLTSSRTPSFFFCSPCASPSAANHSIITYLRTTAAQIQFYAERGVWEYCGRLITWLVL